MDQRKVTAWLGGAGRGPARPRHLGALPGGGDGQDSAVTEAQPPPLQSLRRWDPERIGPYSVVGRLGAGAMGQVYLGRSAAGRLVAVKTIKIEFAEEAGFRSRFAREVAAARRVSGVFTAAVVAADADADVPWLATAYIPAPSLTRLVRACGPLPVPTVRWLAAGCAEALESIHSAGLIHRDLKPSNVLVSPDGPRVIDFGVARAAERIALTVTSGAVGTPAYMAPEQARDTRQATMASDVFSLGATLVFAATGHPPYHGETVMDVLVRLATEPPDLANLPAELAGLVTACLERSPAARPSCAALVSTLGPVLDATAGRGGGQSHLTGTAASLIAAYERGPQSGAQRAGDDEDTGPPFTTDPPSLSRQADGTLGSETGLPGRAGGVPGRVGVPGRGAHQPGGHGTAGQRPARVAAALPGPALRRPWWERKLVAGVAAAVFAAVLVAAGALLGTALSHPKGPPSAAGTTSPAPSAGGTVGAGGFPQGQPPGEPPSSFPAAPSGRPAVVMLQPFGDQATVFLVHGSGWQPFHHVTLTLAGVHGKDAVLETDRRGTFNYALNQGHAFFPGLIRPGVYQVLVTAPGGRRAHASFQVAPLPQPGNPPPPGGPPPGG